VSRSPTVVAAAGPVVASRDHPAALATGRLFWLWQRRSARLATVGFRWSLVASGPVIAAVGLERGRS
jgi:hypothetical protein